MKQKELKNLAKKIAEAELILRDSADPGEKRKAENAIFAISGKITSLSDMCELDEMVQDILDKS